MTGKMLIFGMGYTASRLAARLRGENWQVVGTSRTASPVSIAFDDEASIRNALAGATHILSSVPPLREGGDPVLDRYRTAIATAPANWVGYLSSTGVYGDAQGAWIDESAPIGSGRRSARAAADLEWQRFRDDMRIFRLPGIYGPGRSALERVREGKAHRIDLPGQVFSRIHVDDIVSGVAASFSGPAGVYNLADDFPCSQNAVIEFASLLLGMDPPPMRTLEAAQLSPMAAAFYAENRRISARKAKRALGWRPQYLDYKQGLMAIFHSFGQKVD
jgi:nucleoside-diphosphate-sugar epimerase